MQDLIERTVFREDHEQFRTAARRFFEKEIVPHHAQWERDGIVPKEVWRKAGQEGLLNPMLPEPYGGGGDFGHAAVLLEEIARTGASGLGFPLHSDIVAPYINAYGNKEQKDRWLPRMASGDLIGAIAMTEPGAGSDLKSVRTTARREGDHYLINGAKTFITNGINSEIVIVVAKTAPEMGAKGVSLIVVEDGTPGFSKGRKLEKIGLMAQDTSELFFTDVKVPVAHLLGEENMGFKYLMHELAQERLVVAVRAGCDGVARPDRPRRCTLPITALRVTPPPRVLAIWLADWPSSQSFFSAPTRSSVQLAVVMATLPGIGFNILGRRRISPPRPATNRKAALKTRKMWQFSCPQKPDVVWLTSRFESVLRVFVERRAPCETSLAGASGRL